MNKVILLGRLTRDPEVRYTQSAEPLAVASFSIAVDRRFKRDGEQDVDFINCVCFGKQGENISRFFKKGNRIAVVGRLQVRNWEDNNGQKRVATEVVVEEFDFCESRASSEYSAANAPSYSQPQQSMVQGSVQSGDYQLDNSVDDEDLPF